MASFCYLHEVPVWGLWYQIFVLEVRFMSLSADYFAIHQGLIKFYSRPSPSLEGIVNSRVLSGFVVLSEDL